MVLSLQPDSSRCTVTPAAASSAAHGTGVEMLPGVVLRVHLTEREANTGSDELQIGGWFEWWPVT